jgi:serine kinase of HPr protein (carbohydrate metabolism regulator)
LPLYLLTVMPGRNISLLIEVAALTQRLRDLGQNPAEEINRRMILAMQQKTEVRRVAIFRAENPKFAQGG